MNQLLPVSEGLWKTSFAERREVQGVWLLVRSTSLDVQVLEDMHFALKANLKCIKSKTELSPLSITTAERMISSQPLDGALVSGSFHSRFMFTSKHKYVLLE